jgi:hypothetical protein
MIEFLPSIKIIWHKHIIQPMQVLLSFTRYGPEVSTPTLIYRFSIGSLFRRLFTSFFLEKYFQIKNRSDFADANDAT